MTYGYPLPRILVVPQRNSQNCVRWHDYVHTQILGRYRHSPGCKCRAHLEPIKNLDVTA